MNEEPWTIEYYADAGNHQPVREFVEGLNPRMKAQVELAIERLELLE